MRFRTTLTALLLLFVLSLAAYFSRSGETEIQKPVEPIVRFEEADFTRIRKVEVVGNGELSICERQKPLGWWYRKQPVPLKIDERKLRTIFNEVLALKTDQIITNTKSLAQFGLEPASIYITFWLDNEPVKLALGAKNIKDDRYYARIDDNNDVLLVKSYLRTLVDKNSIDLSSRKVFGVAIELIDAVGYRMQEEQGRLAVAEADTQAASVSPTEADDTEVFSSGDNLFARFRDLPIETPTAKPPVIPANKQDESDVVLFIETKGVTIKLALTPKDELYYYGSRNIDEQVILIKKSVVTNLIETFRELTQEKSEL